MSISTDKHEAFAKLYQEFATTYPLSDAGKKHVASYAKVRAAARAGYRAVLDAVEGGADYTDLALAKLLPHLNSSFNRQRGAWCHFAPAVTREVKGWFENAPHIRAKPELWPAVAHDLVELVRSVVDDPAALATACAAFAAKPQTRGFQTGMLSPILNALRPEVLALVNGKSREVLAFLTGEKVSNAIADYPTTSRLVLEVTEDLGAILDGAGPAELTRLDRFDMFCHWVVAVKGFGPRDAKYWKIAPGEGGFLWDRCREGGYIAVGWDELGDVSALTKSQFDERRDALRAEHPEWTKHGLNQVWRFSQIQEGDRIVANKGWSEVLAVGTVTSGYYFAPDGDYRHRVAVDWYDVTRRQISKHGWSMTLAQIDRADFEEVAGAPPIVEVGGGDDAGGADPGHARPVLRAAYALEDLAQETYQELDEVARWVRAVGRKKQMIFFGPPGTGKTFCAKRLARHLVERTAGFVETVQFHPSYGYEDFIEGIRPRPTDAGGLSYALVKGRFLDACERASRSTDPCVLIIDEINRANLSRVFGELMYLLEYRNDEIPLASGTPFRMPANLLLIGTMNTADRSIALIDHALRRRFAFVRLPPCFEGLRRYHAEHETTFEPAGLIAVLERLNRTIGDPNYAVGVSFFMHEDAVEQMPDIWQMEIEPYLDEYFFDRPTLVDEFRWARVGAAILGG